MIPINCEKAVCRGMDDTADPAGLARASTFYKIQLTRSLSNLSINIKEKGEGEQQRH